jgi:uncharacterized protein
METIGLAFRTFAVALALLAAVWLAWAFAPGMFPTLHKAEPRTITVQGAASLDVQPDKVEVSGAVTTSARSAAEALDQNNLIMARILEGLKEDGIGQDKIRTTGFSITPQHPPAGKDTYRDNELVVTGYVVKNSIKVTLPVGQYSGKLLDRMIRLGATNIDSVAFSVKDAAKYDDQVRALAAKQALHRAKIAATALGQRVGQVISIDRQSDIEPPTTLYAMAPPPAQGSELQIIARAQTFTANLSVVFELESASVR